MQLKAASRYWWFASGLDYAASATDIGISYLESADFMHLKISAPVDSQAP
jgi:hypothetical protein